MLLHFEIKIKKFSLIFYYYCFYYVLYFAQPFEHGKAMCKVGAVFAKVRPKTA